MRTIYKIFMIVYGLMSLRNGYAQGWVAEIDLDFNHDLYAYEKITNAAFTYSGITRSGSSETSNLKLVIDGSGPINGEMTLTIHGLAYEPYYPDDPYSEGMSASFTGYFTDLCSTGFFYQAGETYQEQVYIWIKVYPRLEISDFANSCDTLTFTTNTCSDVYVWEVSEAITGIFKAIPWKNSATISITRNDLSTLGFSDPFGRKYFRVTGRTGTTSQIQAMDIFYPPPDGSLSITPLKCHNGMDGSITVEITSPNPSIINDFVITLFPVKPEGEIKQLSVNDGFIASFRDLSSGTYSVRIENNSLREKYGPCRTDYDNVEIENPAPVTITSFEVSDVNGYAIKCNGGADGTIKVHPDGGTGEYTAYEWIPNVSTTNFAENLSEGSYQVRVRDSNDCWSQAYPQILIAPAELTATIVSTGGNNGFDVSCYDKTDGALETIVAGGVPEYSYSWTDGSTQADLTDLAPGFFEVTVTDVNGCTTTQSATLVAPDAIDFSIAEIVGLTCPGDYSGVLEVQSPVNTIGEVYYTWSTGESGKGIENKPSGTYAATVSDDQGCNITKYHTLDAPDSIEIALLKKTEPACAGECNGQILISATGGYGNYHYAWEDFTGSEATNLCAGTYKVTVTDQKGCSTNRTFSIHDPAPLKIELLSGQPPACWDKCDGSIRIRASGGSGELHYTWSTGETAQTISDLCIGNYTVTIADENECTTTGTFTLEDPPGGSLNLGRTITLCAGQTHELDAGPQWNAYTWGSNTGVKSSERKITIGEQGRYWVEAITDDGCVARDTFLLIVSPDLLTANFLLATQALVGDTVVLIDVSWPVPETISWKLPIEMKRLRDDGDVVYGKFKNAGEYTISLETALGKCRDRLSKTITILSADQPVTKEGRLGHESFVKEFTLYPNPNEGVFDVIVEFMKESFVVFSVWNILTGMKVNHAANSGNSHYLQHIDLRPLGPGAYSLRMDHAQGSKYIRFIVR